MKFRDEFQEFDEQTSQELTTIASQIREALATTPRPFSTRMTCHVQRLQRLIYEQGKLPQPECGAGGHDVLQLVSAIADEINNQMSTDLQEIEQRLADAPRDVLDEIASLGDDAIPGIRRRATPAEQPLTDAVVAAIRWLRAFPISEAREEDRL